MIYRITIEIQVVREIRTEYRPPSVEVSVPLGSLRLLTISGCSPVSLSA